jgi:uncharacterized protein (TIGR00266 family)
MQFDISHQPSYAITAVTLDAGESIVAEAGAMVTMDPGIEIETTARGGLLKSLGRSVLGGESFFVNTFLARSGGVVRFAPSLPGDMTVIDPGGREMLVQSGGFIAADPALEIDTKWGGAKTFFSSEGLIMLRVQGSGPLLLASYGAMDQYDLAAGEEFVVDTGHLVAFDADLGYRVVKAGGSLKTTMFGGEGLVTHLTGPGRFITQSRSQDAFLSWLIPRLPSTRTSSA